MREDAENPSDDNIRELPTVDESAPKPDSKASKEQALILEDKYDEDARERDHNRQQGLKDVAFVVLRIVVVLAAGLLAAVLVVWAIHVLAPAQWRWLNLDEIDRIQTILFSGTLSATITLVGKKIF